MGSQSPTVQEWSFTDGIMVGVLERLPTSSPS